MIHSSTSHETDIYNTGFLNGLTHAELLAKDLLEFIQEKKKRQLEVIQRRQDNDKSISISSQ